MSDFEWWGPFAPWFAWRPVPLEDGRLAFLRVVERRVGWGGWKKTVVYRSLKNPPVNP